MYDGPWENFLRANTFPCERESVTHRFDCNTVGPVPVASGYGSTMLTHSAAYVLRDGNTHASSLLSEAIPLKMDRAPVVESRVSGIQITTVTGSTVSVIPESKPRGTKMTSFTVACS